MNCSKFGEKYLLYHYNELSADEMDEFRGHLESCPKCRSRYDEVVRVLDACTALPEAELGADASARISDNVRTALAKSRPSPAVTRMRLAALIAAGFIIFIGLFVLVSHLPQTGPVGTETAAMVLPSTSDTDDTAELAIDGETYSDEAVETEASADEDDMLDEQIHKLDKIIAMLD
jgi:predicted anti-sigma-YlaC factor YlaD